MWALLCLCYVLTLPLCCLAACWAESAKAGNAQQTACSTSALAQYSGACLSDMGDSPSQLACSRLASGFYAY